MKTSEKAALKRTCEQLYVDMDMNVEECAKAISVNESTIYRWVKSGNWNEKKTETQAIEKQIQINLRKALNQGLKSYAADPSNKDLQSLVSLLKQFKETNKPSQAYKDNIIKFIDRTTDFFLEKGMETVVKEFKKCVLELAEYLLYRS